MVVETLAGFLLQVGRAETGAFAFALLHLHLRRFVWSRVTKQCICWNMVKLATSLPIPCMHTHKTFYIIAISPQLLYTIDIAPTLGSNAILTCMHVSKQPKSSVLSPLGSIMPSHHFLPVSANPSKLDVKELHSHPLPIQSRLCGKSSDAL